MDEESPDLLTPALRDLAARQPEAGRIVQRLRELAAAGRWDTEIPPLHTIDQIEAAVRDMQRAWARGDDTEALAHLKVWAGLLGVE
jgi:hypothetical protein